jgi:acyl carrier protein
MGDADLAARAVQIVNETLLSEFELQRSASVPEARMRKDLGLDSLDAVDLVVALEKALQVRIPR